MTQTLQRTSSARTELSAPRSLRSWPKAPVDWRRLHDRYRGIAVVDGVALTVGKGSFTPIGAETPLAALLPIAAARSSMAAVGYAPATRLHRLNFRDRPTPAVPCPRRIAGKRPFRIDPALALQHVLNGRYDGAR